MLDKRLICGNTFCFTFCITSCILAISSSQGVDMIITKEEIILIEQEVYELEILKEHGRLKIDDYYRLDLFKQILEENKE